MSPPAPAIGHIAAVLTFYSGSVGLTRIFNWPNFHEYLFKRIDLEVWA